MTNYYYYYYYVFIIYYSYSFSTYVIYFLNFILIYIFLLFLNISTIYVGMGNFYFFFEGIWSWGFWLLILGVSPSSLNQLNIEPYLGIWPLIPVGYFLFFFFNLCGIWVILILEGTLNRCCCFGLKMVVDASCGLRWFREVVR